MEEERFKNINILDLAHIVFFNEDAGGTILEELSREEGILERISDAIREQSFNILVDRNSMMMMNKFVEENLAYLSNLYMLLKKKGVEDVNTQ